MFRHFLKSQRCNRSLLTRPVRQNEGFKVLELAGGKERSERRIESYAYGLGADVIIKALRGNARIYLVGDWTNFLVYWYEGGCQRIKHLIKSTFFPTSLITKSFYQQIKLKRWLNIWRAITHLGLTWKNQKQNLPKINKKMFHSFLYLLVDYNIVMPNIYRMIRNIDIFLSIHQYFFSIFSFLYSRWIHIFLSNIIIWIIG